MAESDTPRTDALHAKCIEIEALCWMAGREYVVMRELARTLERELATLRERLAEAEEIIASKMDAITMTENALKRAEQRAERAEQDAERMEAIEKHGLKIVTDFVIDSLVAGRTFGSVRELFDAAIAARSAT